MVIAALWEKPSAVILAGDSQCTIAALEKTGGLLAQYFANRTSEILTNLEEVAALVPLKEVFHVPGDLNPADVSTRGNAIIEDLLEESMWMSGPSFLYGEKEEMPLSRDFLDCGFNLPAAELRERKVSLLATQVIVHHARSLGRLIGVALTKTWNLKKAIHIVARLVKA